MAHLFDELKISLASSEQVRSWSYGEVKKPETINYRTLKPEKDGLFDERIFGPTRDWECYCGKYKRVRFKGVVCERCGVEVTRAKVRRERMGHIELAAPVTHIWFFKGVPSRLGYLLDMSPKELEKVIYFAAYLVTDVDDDKRTKDLPDLEEAARHERILISEELEEWREGRLERLEAELAQMEDGGAKTVEITARRKEIEREIKDREDRAQVEIDLLDEAFDTFKSMKPRDLVESEQLWREIVDRYGEYYTGGMGAEFVKDLISRMDLQAEVEKLREDLVDPRSQQRRQRAQKRLKVVQPFAEGKNDPTGMILEAVPVIPPDLRPMVQLDGGRFATSDMNDLYRRVINRNNRLKRLIDLGAPEIIVNNEKRMLQEAVDALFDNGRRGRAVTGPGNRPLKSLSDMLKGKQGRFRQNLLGKRVDYSGRSVIIVGPSLRLHECGLPKIMALELFKPFVMKRLVDLDIAQNIKAAKRMVERRRAQVWDVLGDVIEEHPVLLNRAPTLHRLGIQAFEPVLIEGKAIQLHPLVCEAFNADFDGDQMAVHLPLSAEAQAEARVLMLSSNNLLSPSNGRPVVTPSHDMVIGMYYLSAVKEGVKGEGRTFSSVDEAMMAYELGDIELHAKIKLRVGSLAGDPDLHALLKPMLKDLIFDEPVSADGLTETTIGRAILNSVFPDGFPYVNAVLIKADLRTLVEEIIHTFDKPDVANTLDNIKDLGFEYSTKAGLTIGLQDVKTPPEKKKILARFEAQADKVESQYQKGVITDDERKSELIDIWTSATDEVKDAMQRTLEADPFNPMQMMVSSGARGNIMQLRQIAGMRGLVANPKGDIIAQPIKANFREGLSVLEYFISTHGARKGLADTALRTADSGYLTRRLVDVSQEIIIHGDESNDPGIVVTIRENGGTVRHLRNKIIGRVLAEDVKIGRSLAELPDGRKLRAGFMLDREAVNGIEEVEEVEQIRVRSPLTDESTYGISQASYGMDLATAELVEPGMAVGIIAAQSIGEPGTQLTMRTFHTGGIAGEDITHGLPRVTELFEARRPKGVALLAEVGGVARVETDPDTAQQSIVISDGGEDLVTYSLSARARLIVADGDVIEPGEQLTDGPLDPKEVLAIRGVRACQQYLVEQVQQVYTSQGVDIHDKHIEMIVRQMLRRVRIANPGDGPWLPAELVDGQVFRDQNRELVEDGKQPAEGRPELMGITKASLATDSWLSAASFQETTRVLTEAAISSKSDFMRGLKENVIIGQLIPAGTGFKMYQGIQPMLPDAEVPSTAALFGDVDLGSAEDALPADPAEWLASLGAPSDSSDSSDTTE